MKQRSPTSQMFRFLLNVQMFYPTGFFIVQYKKNKTNLDKIFNIWRATYIRSENKLISSYESMLCNIVKKDIIIPQFVP